MNDFRTWLHEVRCWCRLMFARERPPMPPDVARALHRLESKRLWRERIEREMS
jgi:hypothetical protein